MIAWIKKKDNYLILIFIVLFLILPFIFFSDTFNLVGKVQGSGDPTTIGLPLYELRISLLKQWDFPFWDVLNYSGYPIYGYFEMNPFYPITLLMRLIFPLAPAYNLGVLIHYSLAGIFMYLLLKEFKLNNLSAFIGGLIFMFSGTMITHRSHPWQIFTIIWFPLILLFIEKYRKSKKLSFLFTAVIIYAVSFLGGSPQLFLYGSIILLAFILFYSFTPIEGKRDYLFLSSLIIFIIGPLLVSFQIFPTIELVQGSVRESISYTFFSDYSFNFKMLPVLIAPFIFGNPFFSPVTLSTYVGSWNYNEIVIYFGLTTVPLMVIGASVKDRKKWLWIALMVFSFVLVLGRSTPFYRIMYHVPIYNMFRVSTRNWFEFGFAYSVLCSFGTNYLMTETNGKKIRKISNVLSSIFIFLLVSFTSLLLMMNTELKSFLLKNLRVNTEKMADVFSNITIQNYAVYIPLIFISITIVLLLLMRKWWRKRWFLAYIIFVIFCDLFCFGHFFEGNADAPKINDGVMVSDQLSFLENSHKEYRIYPVISSVAGRVFAHNKNIYLNSDVITGHIQLLLKDYNYITGIAGSTDIIKGYDKLIKNQSILSMLNTKYILLDETKYANLIKDSSFNLVENYKIIESEDEKIILENKEVLPRFYYIENIFIAQGLEEVKNILWNDTNFDIGNNVIVQGEELTDEDLSKVDYFNFTNKRKIETLPKIIEYKNNSVTLQADNDQLSFLVFSDTYFPGWKVTVNKKPDKIYKVNGILKGVFLPPGENIITFSYLPTNLWFHILISCLTFTVVILICIFERKIELLFFRKD